MTPAGGLKVFIGWDSREPLAYAVLADSILRHASIPVSITPLALPNLRRIYTRERGPTESTEFSLTRFLVPYLSHYEGWSLFLDSDMLCQADILDLLLYPLSDPGRSVYVCQHDYAPRDTTKFLGNVQTVYPRKNWSSLMLFDNARCAALSPAYIHHASGLDLHRFNWLTTPSAIGSIPLDWNWLIGEYAPKADAKILHWTVGGPWLEGYEDADHAALWFSARDAMLGSHVLQEAR